MSLPANFTQPTYLSQLYGNTHIVNYTISPTNPITYDPASGSLQIVPASGTQSGIVSLADQTMGAGIKTFAALPECSAPPSKGEQLVNKAYVDQIRTYNLSWRDSVIEFRDLGGDPPASPVVGDRYIATTTTGGTSVGYIYTYSNGSMWTETIPNEGDATYVSGDASPQFANQAIVCSACNKTTHVATWTGIGSAITYASLIGVPNQAAGALNTTGSPSFAGLTVSGTDASTSSTTGALKVAGGVGIGSRLFVGSSVTAQMFVRPATTLTGALEQLTVNSPQTIYVYNAAASIVKLPDTTTLLPDANGWNYTIVNVSSSAGDVSIQNFAGETIGVVAPGNNATVFCGGVKWYDLGTGISSMNGGIVAKTDDATSTTSASVVLRGGLSVAKKGFFGTYVSTPRILTPSATISMTGTDIPLTISSPQYQGFVGAVATSAILPDPGSMPNGWRIVLWNRSSAELTVKYDPNNAGIPASYITLGYIAPANRTELFCDGNSWADCSIGLSSMTRTINSFYIGASNATDGAICTRGGFSAAKDSYFASNVICPTAPTTGNHLCNKTYVDSLISNSDAFSTHIFTISSTGILFESIQLIGYYRKSGRIASVYIPRMSFSSVTTTTSWLTATSSTPATISIPQLDGAEGQAQSIPLSQASAVYGNFIVYMASDKTLRIYGPNYTWTQGQAVTVGPFTYTYLTSS